MKLFYHFLIFVFASLVLLACANLFASDKQSQSQTDEFPAADHAFDGQVDDSTVAGNSGSPFVLTALKSNAHKYLGYGFDKAPYFAGKNFLYLSNFQVGINQFASPPKFK